MTASTPRKSAPHLKPVRIVRAHIKLFAATALGVVLFLVLPNDLRVTTRALIAWNVAVGLYLVVAAVVISRFELNHVRQRAAEEDEGGALILALTVAAARWQAWWRSSSNWAMRRAKKPARSPPRWC